MEVGLVDLDQLFGEAILPHSCSDVERAIRPESVQVLDGKTGPFLRALTSSVDGGLGVAGFVFSILPILWVIDEAGNFIFACEEIAVKNTMRRLRPRFAKEPINSDETRLGHPALLLGGKGRIGGELFFDPGWGVAPSGWKLTNSSGRYGMLQSRTSAHLENAALLLSEYDIRVDTAFYAKGKAR